ncbi:MAG TPA: PEPxxWA-CTERM sorting domain-containing protein [Caulobacteraceae bacterium]
MPFLKTSAAILMALTISGSVFASAAEASQMVTYSWTTTSEGFGSHVDKPTSATFQVPLSDVLSGKISFSDISNIQLSYPGLTFDTAVTSSIGSDFAAYVDPATGAFIFHDGQQGLAVIASDSSDPSFSTFLSITVDNRYSPFGVPLTSVADQYNALNHGQPYAGFPTAGFWTASFPTVPEPSTWAMLILGLAGVGFMGRRRRSRPASVAP